MKKISILAPCYNEEGNVFELYSRVKDGPHVYEKKRVNFDNETGDSTYKGSNN